MSDNPLPVIKVFMTMKSGAAEWRIMGVKSVQVISKMRPVDYRGPYSCDIIFELVRDRRIRLQYEELLAIIKTGANVSADLERFMPDGFREVVKVGVSGTHAITVMEHFGTLKTMEENGRL